MKKICTTDVTILYLTKILRMFSFGALSVVLFGVLAEKDIKEEQLGFLQSLICAGDIIISLFLTTRADRIGRKNTLLISSILKIFAGVTYALSDNYVLLVISGIVGVMTVSGGEIGPFLPIEQAAIAQTIEENEQETGNVKADVAMAYGYYNMASYLAQAVGASFAGLYISYAYENFGGRIQEYYVHILYFYAFFGFLKVICYINMSDQIQVPTDKIQNKVMVNCAGLTKNSTKIIITLSLLFFIDSFAGGFVAQSFFSFYYQKKYHLQIQKIGGLLTACNIVGGISGVLSSKLVSKIGAMATMIFTHLPSNVLLIMVAMTNNQTLSILFIMGRFCISQMDVPARQTYVSMVVSPEQRSAANGITNIARSVGVTLALPIAGFLWGYNPSSLAFSSPFLIAGILKIIYDLTLGACFLWNKSSAATIQKKQNFQQLQETQHQSEIKTLDNTAQAVK